MARKYYFAKIPGRDFKIGAAEWPEGQLSIRVFDSADRAVEGVVGDPIANVELVALEPMIDALITLKASRAPSRPTPTRIRSVIVRVLEEGFSASCREAASVSEAETVTRLAAIVRDAELASLERAASVLDGMVRSAQGNEYLFQRIAADIRKLKLEV